MCAFHFTQLVCKKCATWLKCGSPDKKMVFSLLPGCPGLLLVTSFRPKVWFPIWIPIPGRTVKGSSIKSLRQLFERHKTTRCRTCGWPPGDMLRPDERSRLRIISLMRDQRSPKITFLLHAFVLIALNSWLCMPLAHFFLARSPCMFI